MFPSTADDPPRGALLIPPMTALADALLRRDYTDVPVHINHVQVISDSGAPYLCVIDPRTQTRARLDASLLDHIIDAVIDIETFNAWADAAMLEYRASLPSGLNTLIRRYLNILKQDQEQTYISGPMKRNIGPFGGISRRLARKIKYGGSEYQRAFLKIHQAVGIMVARMHHYRPSPHPPMTNNSSINWVIIKLRHWYRR